MKKKKPARHVPVRTCIGCKQTDDKRNLSRLVRTPNGIMIDSSGKIAGRGCYLHKKHSCWQSSLKKNLFVKALKMELTDQDIEYIETYIETLEE